MRGEWKESGTVRVKVTESLTVIEGGREDAFVGRDAREPWRGLEMKWLTQKSPVMWL